MEEFRQLYKLNVGEDKAMLIYVMSFWERRLTEDYKMQQSVSIFSMLCILIESAISIQYIMLVYYVYYVVYFI